MRGSKYTPEKLTASFAPLLVMGSIVFQVAGLVPFQVAGFIPIAVAWFVPVLVAGFIPLKVTVFIPVTVSGFVPACISGCVPIAVTFLVANPVTFTFTFTCLGGCFVASAVDILAQVREELLELLLFLPGLLVLHLFFIVERFEYVRNCPKALGTPDQGLFEHFRLPGMGEDGQAEDLTLPTGHFRRNLKIEVRRCVGFKPVREKFLCSVHVDQFCYFQVDIRGQTGRSTDVLQI